MGTKFLYLYFIDIKQLLNSIKWRTDRDSNPGDGHPPTHFPGVRLRPLGHLSLSGGVTAKKLSRNRELCTNGRYAHHL